jgi:uncharacterized protein YbaP (TraB family)
MKKFLKYTLLLSLTGLISLESNSQFLPAKDNKSLLWEVTGNDLQKPAYIYGTMHLLCSKDAVISPNLKQVISEADQIYFEIDMDDLGELLSGFKQGVMQNDTTLTDLYSTEEYDRVKTFFNQHGMGLQFQLFSRMQPMLISALVYHALLPCSQADGMELGIMQLAREYKKEIKGLETAAFQASVLNNISYATQAKELLNSIDSIHTAQTETDEMMELYKEQDVEKLLEYTLKTDAGTSPEVQEIMINQRNRNWVNQFPAITKNTQLLIAVGAGHLGGEDGVLSLLKKEGYDVRPIEN